MSVEFNTMTCKKTTQIKILCHWLKSKFSVNYWIQMHVLIYPRKKWTFRIICSWSWCLLKKKIMWYLKKNNHILHENQNLIHNVQLLFFTWLNLNFIVKCFYLLLKQKSLISSIALNNRYYNDGEFKHLHITLLTNIKITAQNVHLTQKIINFIAYHPLYYNLEVVNYT